MSKRPKTKLRCSKCGYRWKEVVYTSSTMGSTPPYCPKCAQKGIRAIGKRRKIVPLRKRVTGLIRNVVGKPLYYGAWLPVKYSVIKPSLFGVRVGWWSLKMKLWAVSLPLRAAWWVVKLPYRIVEKLLAPPPKVIVLPSDAPASMSGFVGETQRGGFTEPTAPANPGTAGFRKEDPKTSQHHPRACPRCGNYVIGEHCNNCEWGQDCVKCPYCGDLAFVASDGECFNCYYEGAEDVAGGFTPEPTGSTGFAPEPTTAEPCFGAETSKAGFASEGGFRHNRRFKNFGAH